jgi:hypothetical protein
MTHPVLADVIISHQRRRLSKQFCQHPPPLLPLLLLLIFARDMERQQLLPFTVTLTPYCCC